MFLFKGIITVVLIQLANCYHDGAGLPACTSMMPEHGGFPPQTSPAPYSVTPSVTSIAPGGTVTVTIARTNTAFFLRGFMIQARNAANAPIGSFFLTTGMRLMACPNPTASATHTNSDQSISIAIVWNAPAGFTGNVVFHVTAVNNFATFWVGITSPIVTVG